MTLDDTAPVLRVVGGGTPTAEELAALVVVLARPRAATPAPRSESVWADRAVMLRRPLRHGPGMWRRGG